MSDIVPKLIVDDGGHDTIYGFNPLFCNRASILRLDCVDANSGTGASPSRQSKTFCMLGLAHADGCEQSSPSFSTRYASSVL